MGEFHSLPPYKKEPMTGDDIIWYIITVILSIAFLIVFGYLIAEATELQIQEVPNNIYVITEH